MGISSVRVALAVLAFTVIGAVAAIYLDLATQFVLDDKPAKTVGIEAFWAGSAVNAPWLPVLGLVVGVVLASRDGFARSLGLGLLAAMGALMTVGWLGEYVSGLPFTGIDFAVFVMLSVVGLGLSVALMVTGLRELFGTSGPLPVARRPRFEGDEPTVRGR